MRDTITVEHPVTGDRIEIPLDTDFAVTAIDDDTGMIDVSCTLDGTVITLHMDQEMFDEVFYSPVKH